MQVWNKLMKMWKNEHWKKTFVKIKIKINKKLSKFSNECIKIKIPKNKKKEKFVNHNL